MKELQNKLHDEGITLWGERDYKVKRPYGEELVGEKIYGEETILWRVYMVKRLYGGKTI